MTYPVVADTVIVQHYWWDDMTRRGVDRDVTWTPLPYTGNTTPNLFVLGEHGWIKTGSWTSRPHPLTGYMAVPLTATDDPDLSSFPGYRVAPEGETPFTIPVPVDTPPMSATPEMVDALAALTPPFAVTVGATVKAVWLTELASISPSPTPPSSFFTAQQTTSLALDVTSTHDTDPGAHPDIRAAIAAGGDGGAGGVGPYTHTQSSAAATWTITHNLGRYPQVTVVDNTGARLLTDVVYPNANAVTVVHAAPLAGKAYLI